MDHDIKQLGDFCLETQGFFLAVLSLYYHEITSFYALSEMPDGRHIHRTLMLRSNLKREDTRWTHSSADGKARKEHSPANWHLRRHGWSENGEERSFAQPGRWDGSPGGLRMNLFE